MKTKLLLLVLALPCFSWAQTACQANLENAQNAFYNGRFEEVIVLLKDCRDAASDKELKVQILELYARAELMRGNGASVEKSVAEILRIDPYYKAYASKSANLAPVFNNYSIRSPWQFDAYAGPSQSNYRILAWRSIASSVQEAYYEDGLSWFSGFSLSRRIAWGFYATAGVEYQRFAFQREELQNDYLIQSSKERYQFWQYPLGLAFKLPYRNFELGIEGAAVAVNLNEAWADIRLDPMPSDEPQAFPGSPDEITNYDLLGQRRSFGWSYRYGISVAYFYRAMGIRVGLAQQISPYNQVNPDQRYENPELNQDLNYVSDDFAIDQIMFRFGLSYRILKPYKNQN